MYWIVILVVPWNNSGGYGFALPYNLVCWVFMALMVLPITLTCRDLKYSQTGMWMALGALLMTLPVLWASSIDGVLSALPRLTGLWGGVFFYFCLLQVRFTTRSVRAFLAILSLATLVQTAITLVCLWLPAWLPHTLHLLADQYGASGFGIFQQRNVNASFLATGLMAMLALLAFAPLNRRAKWLAGMGIVLVSATLLLVQSRIGWIGGLSGILTITLLAHTPQGKESSSASDRRLIVLLPFLGVLLGAFLLNTTLSGALRAYDDSDTQRWLTLKCTFQMIIQHPWRGWGIGMFKGEFHRFMAARFDDPTRMGHPHNEVLYQWFEGGILALAGGFCCIAGWLLLFFRRKSIWQNAALLMTLPILLHTQVEYPLYFSAPHFMLLLMLLRMSDRRKMCIPFKERRATILRAGMCSVAVYGIVLPFQCLYAGQVLDKFEASRLDNPEVITRLQVPWLMNWRQAHELTMLHLVRFRDIHDISELQAFVDENPRWLAVYPDNDALQNQHDVEKYIRASKIGL